MLCFHCTQTHMRIQPEFSREFLKKNFVRLPPLASAAWCGPHPLATPLIRGAAYDKRCGRKLLLRVCELCLCACLCLPFRSPFRWWRGSRVSVRSCWCTGSRGRPRCDCSTPSGQPAHHPDAGSGGDPPLQWIYTAFSWIFKLTMQMLAQAVTHPCNEYTRHSHEYSSSPCRCWLRRWPTPATNIHGILMNIQAHHADAGSGGDPPLQRIFTAFLMNIQARHADAGSGGDPPLQRIFTTFLMNIHSETHTCTGHGN